MSEPAAQSAQESSRIGPWCVRLALLRYDQPIWLPKGSVRALLALGTTATTLYMCARGIPVPELLRDLTMTVVGFYFGGRMSWANGEDKNGANGGKAP
jgi:hypothetical protein